MLARRIIPCLDVKDGRVVKGSNFEGRRDMADPVEMARRRAGTCLRTSCGGLRARFSFP